MLPRYASGFLLAGSVAVAMITRGWAMMPPEEYRKARDGAQFHLQLSVAKVTPPARFPGQCIVEGKAVTVFRGALARGASMRLEVSCKRDGDRAPPGGEFWVRWEELERARFLEAYVNREGEGYAIATWQSAIIGAPSAKPQFFGKQ